LVSVTITEIARLVWAKATAAGLAQLDELGVFVGPPPQAEDNDEMLATILPFRRRHTG